MILGTMRYFCDSDEVQLLIIFYLQSMKKKCWIWYFNIQHVPIYIVLFNVKYDKLFLIPKIHSPTSSRRLYTSTHKCAKILVIFFR